MVATTVEMADGTATRLIVCAMLLTMRGMPQIYAGDEIAMTGDGDPNNQRNFPGGFADAKADSEPDAFVAARRTPDQESMYAWVKELLSLRAKYTELNSGDERVLYADADTLLYFRSAALEHGCIPKADGRVVVAINRSAKPKQMPLCEAKPRLKAARRMGFSWARPSSIQAAS